MVKLASQTCLDSDYWIQLRNCLVCGLAIPDHKKYCFSLKIGSLVEMNDAKVIRAQSENPTHTCSC